MMHRLLARSISKWRRMVDVELRGGHDWNAIDVPRGQRCGTSCTDHVLPC